MTSDREIIDSCIYKGNKHRHSTEWQPQAQSLRDTIRRLGMAEFYNDK